MLQKNLLALLVLVSGHAWALPIDWHGSFGVDTTLIDNFRRIESTVDNSNNMNAGGRGTQEVPLASGNHANASFQTYVFKLSPTVTVNDSASFKMTLTSGYGMGGRFGEANSQSLEAGWGNALYPQSNESADTELLVSKMYMELYSDTATYMIGRHSTHFGLGAVLNSGDNVWDRHASTRDGVTMKIKLGNFNFTPYWAKISSAGSLTRATKIKEQGIGFIYDNIDRDLAFGVLYGSKSNSTFSPDITQGTTNNNPAPGGAQTTSALGQTDVKITDLYFRKAFGPVDLKVEVPFLSGELGNLYGTNTKYKAQAMLFKSDFKASEGLKFGVDGGKVSGEDGAAGSFDAMYLHPNYQIANVLFRYNMRAVSQPNSINVHDSYISNASFLKVRMEYTTEKWTWETAGIYAIADQAAKAGTQSFNHTTNKVFNAVTDQADDLGFEFDVNFNYRWNPEVNIGGSLGYLFAGDYFAYTNDAAISNSSKDSYALQLKASLEF